MKKNGHGYWKREYANGIILYIHWHDLDENGGRRDELMSARYGVRPCHVLVQDPESPFFKITSYKSTEITSRQYHRKRWKILQKQKGKR